MMLAFTCYSGWEGAKKQAKYAIHDKTKIYFANRIYSEHDREVKSAEIMR